MSETTKSQKPRSYVGLLDGCRGVIDDLMLRRIVEAAPTADKADVYVTHTLGWPSEIGRMVKKAVYLRDQYPDIWRQSLPTKPPAEAMFDFGRSDECNSYNWKMDKKGLVQIQSHSIVGGVRMPCHLPFLLRDFRIVYDDGTSYCTYDKEEGGDDNDPILRDTVDFDYTTNLNRAALFTLPSTKAGKKVLGETWRFGGEFCGVPLEAGRSVFGVEFQQFVAKDHEEMPAAYKRVRLVQLLDQDIAGPKLPVFNQVLILARTDINLEQRFPPRMTRQCQVMLERTWWYSDYMTIKVRARYWVEEEAEGWELKPMIGGLDVDPSLHYDMAEFKRSGVSGQAGQVALAAANKMLRDLVTREMDGPRWEELVGEKVLQSPEKDLASLWGLKG